MNSRPLFRLPSAFATFILRRVLPALLNRAGIGFLVACGACLLPALTADAQPIITVAGNGVYGQFVDGPSAMNIAFSSPTAVVFDHAGNMYVALSSFSVIVKVTPGGAASRIAGTFIQGFSGDGGPAVSARIDVVSDLAIDGADNLYIADGNNLRIRKIDSAGIITTIAGNGLNGDSGDGGLAVNASFKSLAKIASDAAGNIHVADPLANRVRKIGIDGSISTFAGNGNSSAVVVGAPANGDGGPATSASVSIPKALAIAADNTLFISDGVNRRIRKVAPDGIISTIAGSGNIGFCGDGGPALSACVDNLDGFTLDATGNLYFADVSAQRVRKVSTTGVISTVAGNGIGGYAGDSGPATAAALNFPMGVAVDSHGDLFIADFFNHRVRRVAFSAVIPGAPAVGTVSIAGALATVPFTPPASDGGLPILTYMARCGSDSHNASTSPINVAITTAGVPVTCVVSALNSVGWGPDSAPSNSVVATVAATIPSPPVVGTATSAGMTVYVPFAAPASDGGSPISSYTAVCTDGTNYFTGATVTSPVIVNGVPLGTTVTCTVIATNYTGLSAPSAASNAVTASTQPGAPIIGTATAGAGSVTVTFSPPLDNGGAPVTSYRAACGPNAATGATSPIVVHGLTPGIAVACTVSAQNASGTGFASAASNSVIPVATPNTAFYLYSQAGNNVGGTRNQTILPSDGYNFTPYSYAPNHAQMTVATPTLSGPLGYWYVEIQAAGTLPLDTGTYENAVFNHTATSPGVRFYGSDGSCSDVMGRFQVLEISRDTGGNIVTLAVDFEQRCNGNLAAAFGQIRYNSSVPIDTSLRHPTPFSYPPVTGAALNTLYTSPAAAINGISVTVPVTITNGEYSIDNGAFTTADGTVNSGQSIKVRLTSAATANTLKTAMLTVGGFQAPFKVGTITGSYPQPAGDPIIHLVGFPGSGGGSILTQLFSPATLNTITLNSSYGNAGNNFIVAGTTLPSYLPNWNGSLAAPGPTRLVAGNYTDLRSQSNSSLMQFITNGSTVYCGSPSTSNVNILEIDYDTNNTPVKLAMDFVQTCDATYSGFSRIYGRVRFASTVPIDYAIRTPVPFVIQPVTGAAPDTLVNSAPVQIAGVTEAVPISVVGGQYSIDNGPFLSAPGFIAAGQSFRVQVRSAMQANALVSVTITIGGASADFRVGSATGNAPQPGGDPLISLYGQPTVVGGTSVTAVLSAATLATFQISTLAVSSSTGGATLLAASSPSGTWSAMLSGMTTSSGLAPGSYSQVASQPSATNIGLSINANLPSGPYCYTYSSPAPSSSVVIHEVAYLPDGTPSKLAVDFIQTCNSTSGTSSRVYGHIRYNSTVPIDYAILLPIPISFPAVSGASLNTAVESTTASVAGITSAIPVSITGGEYSIDNGAFTSLPGTIANGQSIRLRVTSAPLPNALRSAILNLGDYTTRFDVGTAIGDTPQPAGDPLIVNIGLPTTDAGAVQTWAYSPANGMTITMQQNYGYIAVFANQGGSILWNAAFGGPNAAQLAVGSYPTTTVYGDSTHARLNVSGSSYCSYIGNSMGTMKVLEVEYLPDGTPTKLAIDFVLTCAASTSYTPIYGYVRINSTVPIDYTIRMPAAFTFTPVTNAMPGAVYISNEVTVRGITVTVPIDVAGGEYSIDGGAFTPASGTIGPGQRLRLRATAPAALNQLVTATVTVGERSQPFVVGTSPGTHPQPDGTPVVVLVSQNALTGTLAESVFSAATLADVTLGVVTYSYEKTRVIAARANSIDTWQAGFSGPNQSLLTVGTFPNATNVAYAAAPFFAPSSGYNVPQCNGYTTQPATFKVHEVEHSITGQTLKLALDFVQPCNIQTVYASTPSIMFGYIRINSSVPIDYAVRIPTPLIFTPVAGAAPGAIVESNEITVQGINVPVPVSVTGGEFSIDGGAYSAAASTIIAGQKLRVRLTAPAGGNALGVAAVNVGDGTGDFKVGTALTGTPVPNGAPLIYLISQGTDPIGGGHNYLFSPATFATIGATRSYYNGANVTATQPAAAGNSTWTFEFNAGGNNVLATGTYNNTVWYSSSASPTLSVIQNYTYCSQSTGSFTVLEVSYNGSLIDKLAVDFTNYCNGNTNPLYGYVRINSTIPIVPVTDSTPSPFSFPAQTGAPLSTLVTSASATVRDFTAPAAISIIGGEYSIDNGPFTALPGTINAGQSVRVRLTSSTSYATSTTATLTVAGVSATFTVQTAGLDNFPDPFSFGNMSGVPLNQWINSPVVTVTGINSVTTVTINGGEFSVGGRPFTSAPSAILPGETIQVRLMSSTAYNDYRISLLSVGGYTAQFGIQTLASRTLTLSVVGNGAISGLGGVGSQGSGVIYALYCSSPSCPNTLGDGLAINLTATPQPGYRFTGWTGGTCAGTAACAFTLNADASVMAIFVVAPPDAPSIVSAIGGNGLAILTILPANANGGPAVISYTATCNPGMVTAASTSTTIVVGPLVNDTAYSCSVAATSTLGTGTPGPGVNVTPTATAPLSLVSVQSRKTHGSAGVYDLPIDYAQPVNGSITVEPRAVGAGHQVVFQFNLPVTGIGAVSVVDATGNPLGSATTAINGNEVAVALTGIADATRVTVAIANVSTANGMQNASASLGYLAGDVNGSRSVNSTDISSIKSRSGQTIDTTNFRFDINASGSIGAADISLVKARNPTSLP